MDRPRRPTADPPDRGLLGLFGLVRTLLALVVACVLIGAAALTILAGPTLIDEIDAHANPITTEDPPPAGERDPETTDPDDPGASAYEGAQTTFDSADVEDFIHHEVNDRRAEEDLKPLEWDGTIASVSRAHSADMHDRDYFAHENPDGESPFDRFSEVGDYCRAYGENIAMTVADRRVREPGGEVVRYRSPEELAEGLVEQWMNSPPHREAILSDRWDRGGVGVYLSEEGEVYATHNFCTVR